MESTSWIHTAHASVILLNTTKEAERICKKNGGLSVEQLLNAFGVFSNADTPVRTINGHITLPELRLRFLSTSNFKIIAPELSAAKVNQVISSSAENLLSPTSPDKIPQAVPTVETEDDIPSFMDSICTSASEPMPWYPAFKHEIIESFQCEETSMMYQPHAMLLVVSSTEGDPRHAFQQLGLPQNLPMVFQDGLFDMNLPKYHVILHDTCETRNTSIDPDAIYRNLSLAPNSGGVARINSTSTPIYEDLWSSHPYVRDLPKLDLNQPFGCYLSEDDRLALRTLIWDFGVKFVLPAMESKLFSLNETVAAVRKGVRNALKAWWRKPKDTSSKSTTYLYRYDSIESNMRQLADIAFLIRDYELAYNMYRLVRDDYKNDKAMLHCAHANEAIALCLFMMNGSVSDIHNALETVVSIYARLQVSSPQTSLVRHSTRASIISSEIYSSLYRRFPQSELMDSASSSLMRGSSATDSIHPNFAICAAVLLERAAFCDILARSTKFRKFGFRMVMAGHVYSTMGYAPHAARCYASARAIYANTRWYQVDDHITGTLARQLYGLNLPQQAIVLFLTRIGSGRHSKSQQMTLLTEFYDMVSECLQENNMVFMADFQVVGHDNNMKVLLVKSLAIPAIHDSSVVVFAHENASEFTMHVDMNDAHWKQLEFALLKEERIEELAKISLNWLELSNSSISSLHLPQRSKKKNLRPRTFILGETVYVEFQMKNHLACEVELKQLHLYGMYGTEIFPSRSTCVSVEHQDVTLAPYAEIMVRLSLRPKQVGQVQITGVRWALNSCVHGEHSFQLPGVLLQDSLKNRATRARAPDLSTTCDIQPAMPWLGVSVYQDGKEIPSPLVCLEGEVVVLELLLVNRGIASMDNLTIVCTNWQFVIEHTNQTIGCSGVVKILSDFTLQPGEHKSFRIFCRSLHVGPQNVRFLFRYGKAGSTCQRLVTLSLGVETLKSLQVTHAIHPSYDNIGEYILALTVHNGRKDGTKEATPTMSLLKVIAWSPYWSIENMLPCPIPSSCRPGSTLQWQETCTSYFRITQRTGDDSKNSVTLVDEQPVEYPFVEFLCLDQAKALTIDEKKKVLENGVGSDKNKLLRSIQSVRRENKNQTSSVNNYRHAGFKPTSEEALMQPEVEMHLVLQWAGTGAVVNSQQKKRCFGQSNLLNIQIRTPYLATSNTFPLTMALSYPDVVSLREKQQVPVTLHLRNDAAPLSPSISFTIEMLAPDEEHPSVRSSNTGPCLATPRVFWSGYTRQTYWNLKPNSGMNLSLTASFVSPGIYDMNRFRFVVTQNENKKPLTVFFPVEYLIQVLK
ncbi:Aste57867_17888 [Aphanomyces stellatus]|uniref:Aste57867_17888 protein n=1 Tax=Aphanomyces stellatus TaxID=120398 RepID=A0A485L903_9STRA|nr:hypothetical protein As57867_017827 [Aphanomyces stellatus]VFT94630.1 Aste57867_17888 [Aphanomyces stellatus]